MGEPGVQCRHLPDQEPQRMCSPSFIALPFSAALSPEVVEELLPRSTLCMQVCRWGCQERSGEGHAKIDPKVVFFSFCQMLSRMQEITFVLLVSWTKQFCSSHQEVMNVGLTWVPFHLHSLFPLFTVFCKSSTHPFSSLRGTSLPLEV